MRGGLTFVFTDLEGSTHLIEDLGSSYGLALRIHRQIVRSAFEEGGGQQIDTAGDGLFFVFNDPARCVDAAVAAQQKIQHYQWPDGVALKVRMGIHCGPVSVSGGEYVGLTVHEAARICAAAHGGQILVSSQVAEAVDGTFRDLGVYRLRGISTPHHLLQVVADGLEDDFPPPRDAVRDGGTRVSIWRRENGAVDGQVDVEFRRASNGSGDAFRLIVSRDGVVEEEFDGLTVGGASDAASIVNAHSRLIRLDPAGRVLDGDQGQRDDEQPGGEDGQTGARLESHASESEAGPTN